MVCDSRPNQTFWRIDFNLLICRVLALLLLKFSYEFHSGCVEDCINDSLLKSILYCKGIIVGLQDDKITEGGSLGIFNLFDYQLRLLEKLWVAEFNQIFPKLGTHKQAHTGLIENTIQICLFVAQLMTCSKDIRIPLEAQSLHLACLLDLCLCLRPECFLAHHH